MHLYISGSFAQRERLAAIAGQLEFVGYDVTSSWLYEPPIRFDDEHADYDKRARANEDLIDIERAEAVLLFTDVPSTSGGFDTELGMALMGRKPVYLYGPRINIFTYMHAVIPPTPEMEKAIEYVDNQIAKRAGGLVLLEDRR